MQPKKGKRDQRKKNQVHRYLNAPKNKPPTEVSIERDDNFAKDDSYYGDRDQFLILHVGSHVIDVTSPSFDSLAVDWVNGTLRDQRHLRRGGGPLVVSLCAFKGFSDLKSFYSRIIKGPIPDLYRAISICIGGSHVLFYRHDIWDGNNFQVKPLKQLLENNKVVVIGLGIKEIAKKLLHQWGLRITHPMDVRKVVASAYGKNTVWWPTYDKGLVVMDSLELEEMAELVLEGIRLEKKPAKVLQADWRDYHDDTFEMELTKYAGRDAFITYEIATKCIEKAGRLPSDA